jgi:hypothetical protein
LLRSSFGLSYCALDTHPRGRFGRSIRALSRRARKGVCHSPGLGFFFWSRCFPPSHLLRFESSLAAAPNSLLFFFLLGHPISGQELLRSQQGAGCRPSAERGPRGLRRHAAGGLSSVAAVVQCADTCLHASWKGVHFRPSLLSLCFLSKLFTVSPNGPFDILVLLSSCELIALRNNMPLVF